MRVGRYETIRPIAAGGMATVYLGRASGAGGFARNVAIKVMHPHLAVDDEYVTMFLDEARMAANLRHPNVVPTLDVAEENGVLFLVMEFVDGFALSHLLKELGKQGTQLPIEVALRLQLDFLAGLEAAHGLQTDDGLSMNLVHRDVSPHNVLVGKSGLAQLMDFGIARANVRDTSTAEGKLKGKLHYMAPEQLLGKDVDRRTDVYAAGIVLWEMLAGRRMLEARNPMALARDALHGVRERPSKHRPEVPIEIERVCMRAFMRVETSRYPSAGEFADDLEEAARQAGLRIASHREVARLVADVPSPKEPETGEWEARASDSGSSSRVSRPSGRLTGSLSRGSVSDVVLTESSEFPPEMRSGRAASWRSSWPVLTLIACMAAVIVWLVFRGTPQPTMANATSQASPSAPSSAVSAGRTASTPTQTPTAEAPARAATAPSASSEPSASPSRAVASSAQPSAQGSSSLPAPRRIRPVPRRRRSPAPFDPELP